MKRTLVVLMLLAAPASNAIEAERPTPREELEANVELPKAAQELLPQYVQLFRTADSLVAYAVGEWYPNCTPNVEIDGPMINCYQVMARSQPVPSEWVDSIANWVARPG